MRASENPFVEVRPHPSRDRGRRFTRREVLVALGGVGIACLTDRLAWAEDASGGVCIARPAQTEGPFFVEEALERSDIRSDPATGRQVDGTALKLEFVVGALSNGRCAPLPGAKIDVWHCDASGRYSDVISRLRIPADFLAVIRVNLGVTSVLAELGATGQWAAIYRDYCRIPG